MRAALCSKRPSRESQGRLAACGLSHPSLFVPSEQEIFQEPGEHRQAPVVPIAAWIELREGHSDYAIRPDGVDEAQQVRWVQAERHWMRDRRKGGGIKHVAVNVEKDAPGRLAGGND